MFIATSTYAQKRKHIEVKYYKQMDRSLVENDNSKNNYTIISPYNKHLILTGDNENPSIKIQYDKPGEAYDGKEVMYNDGISANIDRNINYLNESANIPPINGRSRFKNSTTFLH